MANKRFLLNVVENAVSVIDFPSWEEVLKSNDELKQEFEGSLSPRFIACRRLSEVKNLES